MLRDVEGLWVDEEEQVCHPEKREQYQGCPDSPFHLRKVIPFIDYYYQYFFIKSHFTEKFKLYGQ